MTINIPIGGIIETDSAKAAEIDHGMWVEPALETDLARGIALDRTGLPLISGTRIDLSI